MAELNFQFDKTYDEIEVNGEIYKLYFDDDSLDRYQKLTNEYYQEAQDHEKKMSDIENLSEQEFDDLKEQGRGFMERFVDGFFGEGSFGKLYEASGRSMINMMPLVEYAIDWLDSKVPETDEKRKSYYTKKKRKSK